MKAANGRDSVAHDCLVTDLIVEHVEAHPDAEAICSSDGESLSYRALDNASRRLASHLTTQGVKPEVIVPLCFEKSIWTVVAIVAVLKAGGAFVLLDPAHPTERLETIIRKCQATVAVTSRASQKRIAQLVPRALCLDRHALGQLAPTTPRDPASGVAPGNAAYVVYTSGSTGQPKGAVIEHGSFCAGALGHAAAMGMDAATRAVQFASYNFDASITEMLTTLAVGGTVCVVGEAARLDAAAFAAAVAATRANFALLTASFINALPVDGLPGLRTLVQGGEALPEAVKERWAERVTLMNAYGQVEASVVSTCTPPISRRSNGRSIGTAVAGRCWVVDPDDPDARTPAGEVGELLVEGPHVGRGYLGEPEKTAAVYVGRPLWHARLFPAETDPRALRFYRTGDLVVQEPDGSFTFAGRKDEQVKVNGQRIELGEIEHQFKRAMHPPRDIVVELVKRKAGSGTRGILVAFVALDGDWHGDETAAQRRLDGEMAAAEKEVRAILPKFMMPASFVAVQNIPISINGKVDRRSLRALGEARLSRKQQHVGTPGGEDKGLSPVEAQLRQVWSRVLNVPEENIERTSMFQSLGGDSISAMQVVSQAAARGVRISVQRILQKKTIEQIASGLVVESSPPTTEPLDEDDDDTEEPFKLSPIQQLFFQLSPEGENRDNISFLLRLNKKVSRNMVDEALEGVVNRNPMLRARFFELKRGNWFQYISQDTFESYHISAHAIDDTSDVMPIVRKSQRSLDIKYGPLLRADLFTLKGGREQLLFLCAHHLVTDFVSWRVMLQQLEEYIQSGTISSPKGFSFQRWCQEQEKHLRNLPAQELPFQLPEQNYQFWGMQRLPNVYGDSFTEELVLDRELSSTILGTACPDVEAVDVLLSAVMFAFHTSFPERSVPAFFVEGHGREPSWDDSIDLSSTVGWFTTLLPIVLSEAKCKHPIDALREIKSLRAQFTDKGLAQFASKFYQRRKARYPSMEITFNYAGMYQQLERSGGLFSEVPEYTLMNLDGFGARMPRFGLVEILGNVEHGQIKLSFTINRRMRHQERLREWMQQCQSVLATMASQLAQAQPGFPLLGASDAQLTRLVDHVLPGVGVGVEDVEDVYPCSPMQNGMLLSRAGERGSYNSQLFLELRSTDGHIDTSRLERAWQAVIDRHAVLRTLFVESVRGDGSFDQVVLRQAQGAVTHVDDLEREPLAPRAPNEPEHRLFVQVVSRSHVRLRLDISHVLIDGSSTSALMRDIQREYDSPDLLAAEPRPLYSTYIEHVSTLSHEHSVEYWKENLSGAEPCHLPQWSDEQDGTLEFAAVPPINTAKITAFCRQNGITVSDLLKTAWAIVLRCYTGSDAPVFGYLSSGRGAEHDQAVGVFTNILPCLARLSPTSTVLNSLRKIQDDGIEQMPHKECPLADVMHAADVADAAREGLFNTAMSLQKVSSPSGDGSLAIRMVREKDPTEFAATFLGYISDAGIELVIEYWTSRISTAQAQNLASTVSKVVQSMTENPQSTIGDLDVLSGRDVDSVRLWNSRLAHNGPINSCIHHLIKQVAKNQPDRPAVHAWDERLTYGQLEDLSSRLAGHLHNLGILPDQIIPVCMEKSAWTVVSMLAVLKAGGAFVPFDTEAPLDRLLQLLKDTSADFVIASPKTAHRLQDHIQQILVSSAFISRLPERVFEQTVMPNNLAYVLFTSGSTGTPKGIMMQHSQFLASSTRYSAVLGLNERSRILQFSAYTFDASIFEVWSTLTTGGCVCQMSEEQRMNDVTGAIHTLAADTMFMTPTMLSIIEPRDVPSIRTVITGGEVIKQDIFRTWAPAVRLLEAYGPTETAVFATFQDAVTAESDRFSIGQSFCCQAWVVDPGSERPVPVGAAGELWLEGPSLARGYLNNAAQTAAAFVARPDWFDRAATRRFYRTGDLVRYKADGSIQFCGRKDTQVKIRGQRVELSEVEEQAKLVLACSAPIAAEVVQSKLVLLVEMRGAPAEQVAATVEALETLLPNRLPRYMVPSAIVPVMEAFQRMSSGKLDRKWLRAVAAKQANAQRTARQGSGRLWNGKLQRALSRVLGLPESEICGEDNFFHLGGDSFLAMKLVAAARAEDLHLSVAAILRNPVLSDMAKTLESVAPDAKNVHGSRPFELIGDLASSMRAEAVAAFRLQSADEIEDIYPATPLQEAFIVESTKNATAYTAQHVVELPSGPDFDMDRFRAAWETCVQEHPILRTKFFQTVKTKPPRPMQVVLRGVSVEWGRGEDLNAYLHEAAHNPVTPLNKVAIINDRRSGARLFVWLAHHTLYDGYSLDMLLGRVHNIYSSNVQAAPKPVPFQAYVGYLRGVKESRETASFWMTYLAGAPAPSFPPTLAVAAKVDSVLDYNLRLPQRSKAAVTLATTLQTAWAIVVAAFSGGAQDVVFGSIVSGRSAPMDGIAAVTGPTIAAIPVRVRFSQVDRVQQLLLRVQEQSSTMIPHEALGLQNIQALSQSTSRACAFKNLFVVQPAQAADAPYKVTSEALNVGSSYSYPLTVVCSQLDDRTFNVNVTYASAVLRLSQVEQLMREFQEVTKKMLTASGSVTVEEVAVKAASLAVLATGTMQSVAASSSRATPMTEMEIKLQELWTESLDLEEPSSLSVDDDFLRLGGDSITAMQLSGVARREGFSLRVVDILGNPVLSEMALCMTALVEVPEEDSETPAFYLMPDAVPIHEYLRMAAADTHMAVDDIEDMYPCTPLQEGLMTASSTQTGSYVAQLVVDLQLDDLERFKAAWESVVATHPILRTRIVHLGAAGMFQTVLRTAKSPVDWRVSSNLDAYVAQDSRAPMGFGDALVRYGIVTSDGDGAKFVWTAHHAVYDGATVAMLSEAVSNAYSGSSPKAPPPFSRLMNYLSSLDPAQSDDFWRSTLAGAKPTPYPLPLSLDYTPHADAILTHSIRLPRKPTTTTTATLLQTAWAYVLARYSGSDDVVLGVAQSGRLAPVPDIARIPGPAVVTAPLRIRFDGRQSVAATLDGVQRWGVESIAHLHRGLQHIRRVADDARLACDFRSLLTMLPQRPDAEMLPFDLATGRLLGAGAADFHTYPLLLECAFADDAVALTATLDASVVDGRQVGWMMAQLEHVLRQLMADDAATKRVAQLELLTPEDCERIRAWSACALETGPAWVVDLRDRARLAPAGVVGELFVEQPGRAEIARPVRLQQIGRRVYATGKLARFGCDGVLDVVGEKDELVELDGRRFVAGDVERLVSQALWNREAAVKAVNGTLTAFVALDHGYVDDEIAQKLLDALVSSVGNKLSRALPSFMVPTHFIPVRSLPRTASGSIDRQRLAELASKSSATSHPSGVPERKDSLVASGMEQNLMSLWKAVLDLEDVGVGDSFLRLGGDSLDAMKLVAAARREGILLTVKEVFDNPILSDLAEIARVAEVDTSPHSAVEPFCMLGGHVSEAVEEVAAACQIDKELIEDIYPCAPLQEGLMALSNVEQGAYVAECVVRVPDAERTEGAWKSLVAMTPVLRTRIVQTDQWGSLQVVVREDAKFQYGQNLNHYLTTERQLHMLPGTHLVRPGLVTEGNSTYFVLFAHHAIFDGWAWKLILQRLYQLYQGHRLLPSPPYSAFVKYLHEDLHLEAAQDFWRSYLEGADRTVFPPMPPSTTPRPESHETRRIKLQRQSTATASSLIQTAWALLVSRYVDSQDVTIAVTLSGRSIPVDGIQDMIGPTFTTIPMRFNLDGSKQIADICKTAQDVTVNPVQHLGLQRIKQLSASAHAACDFNSLLVVQPASNDDDDGNFFLQENDSQLISSFSNYGLVMLCQLLPDGNMDASVVFDPSITSQQQTVRILGQFEHILHQLSNDRCSSVREIDFLSPDDKHEISDINKDLEPHPDAGSCLHEILRQRARTNPHAPVVSSWDGNLTYAELDELASRLAGYLTTSMGVVPGAMVPLCFEKSKWTQVAMLGVMKAGAAFVLLDPAHPISRIQSTCRKVNAKVAVVSAGFEDLLSEAVQTTVVLNQQAADWLKDPYTPIAVNPTDAAYVVTTSGTSGEPKACVIEHGSIVAGALAFAATANLNSNTRALQFASYSFDASIIETLMVWVAGGCVCVLSETDRKDNLPEAIMALQINWALMTPSLASLLKPEAIPTMKTIVIGGEAATSELLSTWTGNVELLQAYGPCECTPVACCSPVPLSSDSNPRDIGRPLNGVKAWVVNPSDHDKLMPVGSVGELMIEGRTVGKGYINEPEKTAAAFIATPLWRQNFPGYPYRFYKTGDLVRYGASGTLEFIGRKDSQVKLRGQRLELAEIEHHLRRSMAKPCDLAVELITPTDQTAASAVLAAFIAVGDTFGDSKNSAGQKLEEVLGDARSTISTLLPSYMIPRLFVPLRKIPLSVSGKVDRKALRKMESKVNEIHIQPVLAVVGEANAPRTSMEQTLQSLWARVLNTEISKIHTQANFTDLGGDSLTAMRLASRARQAGISLSVADIMRQPQFVDMAAKCQPLTETETIPEVEPFSTFPEDVDQFLHDMLSAQRSDIEDVVEATAAQKAMTEASLSPQKGTINHVWLDFGGLIDVSRMKDACSTVVNHHSILRTVFIPHNETLMQVVYRSLQPEFREYHADENIEEMTTALVEASKLRMESYGDYGLRFSFIHYTIDNKPAGRLIMRIPHSLYDGISLPIVLDHLRAAYEKRDLDITPSFSSFLYSWRHLQEIGGAEDFWRKQLKGSRMTEIAAPAPRSATNNPNTHLTQRLPLSLFSSSKHTFETLLHASWALVLHSLTGHHDILFGRGVANRSLPLPTVVGPTLNTVPVRVQLSDRARPAAALLSTVEDTRLAALPHELLETDRLVARCTDWPRAARFSSLLVHNNLDAAKAFDDGRLPPVGGVACRLGWAAAPWDAADVQITSTPEASGGSMRVDLIDYVGTRCRNFDK
ncbi:AMP-dependent synthetase/ligase [Neofusicoccum parvum]|uniref:AMP-dependent synthetase/ligase n=1 Tax=Neofusicoccum parvum TaxID=310453 RepID=A0ACB5SLG1_9PEZI|nr:AMP-dependent synthetase/ligase [Neofusicoccum parvum]